MSAQQRTATFIFGNRHSESEKKTVKRFFAENGHIRLQPENPAMSPIIVEKCTILGKVTGLFRKF
jgi:repressor LexA